MISILICTHNRAEILSHCLNSFCQQTAGPDLFEVIVVDNKSSDNTREVVLSFTGRIRHLRYVYEERVGLSHARNRGFEEAGFEWVSYVDDDAKAHGNYVERALLVINNYNFACFGGRFFPWYLEPKPKWLPDQFGLFPSLLPEVGELPRGKEVAGGVIVFRKGCLIEIGGFPVHLGMAGTEVGYGEENWVQSQLRMRNHKIGFDPELRIDHLVASYKYQVSWHFKRLYAKGRTDRMLNHDKRTNAAFKIGWALLVTVKECVKNVFRLLFVHRYFYQNYLLDSFGFLVKTIGFVKQ